jgi:hypothetical protein
MEIHPIDVRENICLPSERFIRRLPSIAAIAALDALLATAGTAILCDNPSIQELMDMIEDDEKVPPHLFIAHNIVDNIDRLRLTIHNYIEQIEINTAQITNNHFPF